MTSSAPATVISKGADSQRYSVSPQIGLSVVFAIEVLAVLLWVLVGGAAAEFPFADLGEPHLQGSLIAG